jgi:hypothetical protein
MKLSTKASALAFAALWGGCLLFVGLLNAVFPPYGAGFLRLMSSVYPFYSAVPTVAGVLVGTIWGILDGAVAGFLFSWLYNWFLSRMHI